ncbi:hypothetical protein BKA69DRAFT_1170604 [Paraphysoderma sedebokerense]|nr:hypothetical protein BKA69DRAFT_1170604 [Paraphysoderma sedebokerense]
MAKFSSSSITSLNFQRQKIIRDLSALFPDADPIYLDSLINYYDSDHVERITQKIVDRNNSYYPTCVHPDPNSTESYNLYLDILDSVFPDLIEELVKQGSKYPIRREWGKLERFDYFRSPEYIKGCRCRLYNDFPKLWKSSIKAFLAESNYDYVLTHAKLKTQSESMSLFSSLINLPFSILMQRKPYNVPEMNHWLNFNFFLPLKLHCQISYQTISLSLANLIIHSTPFRTNLLPAHAAIHHYRLKRLFGNGSLRGKEVKCFESGGCTVGFSYPMLERALNKDTLSTYYNSLLETQLETSTLEVAKCPFCFYVEYYDPTIDLFFVKVNEWAKGFVPVSEEKLGLPLACLSISFLLTFIDMKGWTNLGIYTLVTSLFGPIYYFLAHLSSFINPLYFKFVDMLKIILKPIPGPFLSSVPVAMLSFFAAFSYLYIRSYIEYIAPSLFNSQSKLQPEQVAKKLAKPCKSVFKCNSPSCGKQSCLLCQLEFKPFHKCNEFDGAAGETKSEKLRLYVEKAMSDSVKRVLFSMTSIMMNISARNVTFRSPNQTDVI